MTCFAFGAKCGPTVCASFATAWSASGVNASRRSFISDASATVPRPKPASRKKWRRVMSFNARWFSVTSSRRSLLIVRSQLPTAYCLLPTAYCLLLRHRFIQVQQRVRNQGPCRALGLRAGGFARCAIFLEHLRGVAWTRAVVPELCLVRTDDPRGLDVR